MKTITIEIDDKTHEWLKRRAAGARGSTVETRAAACLALYVERAHTEECDPLEYKPEFCGG